MDIVPVCTEQKSQLIEITDHLQRAVKKNAVSHGVCTVFLPHTTAGLTVNENADPDVVHDILGQLEAMVPWDSPSYRHREGNSAAHVKASLMGNSIAIPIVSGNLCLGTWQGVYFCEFDGPRQRKVYVMCHGSAGCQT